MGKLSINDLINKKDNCLERLKTKTCFIHSEFLGGEIEFHSLTQGDLSDAREKMKIEGRKGILYFIYLSADDLRDKELLKAYSCDKRDNYKIVERLFTEAERAKILEILQDLNGLNEVSPNEIYQVQLNEIKN